ncbi:MAG TPA: RES family NAD+ phosphorylase, partial [Longimicrobium sp.]|nr:RES family NAD+ phosphorylase [Longimicrobium sp.]
MAIALPKQLPLVTLPARTGLWRVHRKELDALWFGPDRTRPPAGRFAAPGHEFGVCYFGDCLEVAVLETIVRSRTLPIVEQADLEARAVTQLTSTGDLRMLRFEGAGLPVLRVSAGQTHAEPYRECQQMALALHDGHPDVDGIQYRSRWDNSRLCWAVFDRAAGKLSLPGSV